MRQRVLITLSLIERPETRKRKAPKQAVWAPALCRARCWVLAPKNTSAQECWPHFTEEEVGADKPLSPSLLPGSGGELTSSPEAGPSGARPWVKRLELSFSGLILKTAMLRHPLRLALPRGLHGFVCTRNSVVGRRGLWPSREKAHEALEPFAFGPRTDHGATRTPRPGPAVRPSRPDCRSGPGEASGTSVTTEHEKKAIF